MSTIRVGFIGLGHHGAGHGAQPREGGVSADRHDAPRREGRGVREGGLRGRGPSRRPEEVGRESDVIVSSVPDSPEVEEVHLGERGTASGAARGAIVIDTSTIAAEAARGIAARLSERGIAFLDAPVSGRTEGGDRGDADVLRRAATPRRWRRRVPVFAGDGQADHAPGPFRRRAARKGGQPDPRRRQPDGGLGGPLLREEGRPAAAGSP